MKDIITIMFAAIALMIALTLNRAKKGIIKSPETTLMGVVAPIIALLIGCSVGYIIPSIALPDNEYITLLLLVLIFFVSSYFEICLLRMLPVSIINRYVLGACVFPFISFGAVAVIYLRGT